MAKHSPGPLRITTTLANGQIIDKLYADYTNEDFEKAEEQERALATFTMPLSPDIAQRFREYTSTKALWEALIEVYEGNEHMKESQQYMLRQKFNMFKNILGETLETQLQHFTTLTTEMSSTEIYETRSEMNKKLLNSLS